MPLVQARPSTRSTPKTVCSTTPVKEFTVAVTRSIASRARSRLLTLTFYISQLPSPRNRAMAAWSDGYRGDVVRRRPYAGTDFIIARDGRIAAVYLFFDKLP